MIDEEYMTVSQAAKKWDLTTRRIYDELKFGMIEGAVRIGHIWLIPAHLDKPGDRRYKNGEYIGWRQKHPSKKAKKSPDIPEDSAEK